METSRASEPERNPVFRNPDKYLECRSGKTGLFFSQQRAERAALDRCLNGLDGIRTILDVPSGPGRLFEYWKSRGWRVLARDVSPQMAEAAARRHRETGLEGDAAQGDAFQLRDSLPEPVDLVASVRFAYYFNRSRRIRLLRELASVSRRYVLVQYKTDETIKGQANLVHALERGGKPKKKGFSKEFLSYGRILDEVRESGLVPIRIEPIGEFSDRAFIVAEKPEADPALGVQAQNVKVVFRRPRRLHLPLALLVIFALFYGVGIGDREFWTQTEGYFALGGRAALEGDWLLPYLPSGDAVEHPPLTFWTVAAASFLRGDVTEWTARLPSLLSALGVLALTLMIARRWFGRPAGLLAAAVLGTSWEFWQNAAAVSPTMLSAFFLTAAWWGLFRLVDRGWKLTYGLTLWGGLTLALLARGPIVLALTLILVPLFCLWSSDNIVPFRMRLARLRLWPWLPLAIFPWLLWMTAVGATFGWQPLREILVQDPLVQAFTGEDHSEPPYYALVQAFVNLLPWAILLPLVAWRLGTRLRRHRRDLMPEYQFALSAIFTLLAFFTLSRSVQDYYLLPLMPWAAVLFGDALWVQLCRALPVNPQSGVCDADHQADVGDQEFAGRMLGLRRGRAMIWFLSAVLLLIFGYGATAGLLLDDDKSMRGLARAVDRAVDHDDVLILLDEEDPRLMFYLREQFAVAGLDRVDRTRLSNALKSNAEFDLLIPEADLRDLIHLAAPTPLYLQATSDFEGDVYYLMTTEPAEGARIVTHLELGDVSGLAWRPGADSLFVATDEGGLAEVDLHGRVLRRASLSGDFTAAATHPGTGHIWIVDEAADELVEVDPATLKPLARYELDFSDELRDDLAREEREIEGLAFIASPVEGIRLTGIFEQHGWLLEIQPEKPSDSAEMEARVRGIGRFAEFESANALAPSPDAQTLLIMNESENLLLETTASGRILQRWRIPGHEQEGIAALPDGAVYVCDENGLLRVYEPGVLKRSILAPGDSHS